MLIAAVLVALVIGVAAGYFVRAGELSLVQAELAKASESKGMLEEELSGLMGKLQKANESKAMLEEELRGKTVPFAFASEKDRMIHDAWLFIAPVGQDKWAVIIRAEGLDYSPDGIYLVEGVTRTEPMQMFPIGPTEAASEFHADQNGVGVFWVVVDKDPRIIFEKIVILFLPGMSMQNAVLVATAKLS